MTNAQIRKLNQKISRRLCKFPGFPGGKNNSSRFPEFPGVLNTLKLLLFMYCFRTGGIILPGRLINQIQQQQQQRPFYGPLSGTTRVSRYQKKHSPTHHPDWSSTNLYHLLPSITIHSLPPVQITCFAIFLHNLFPCPLWPTSWPDTGWWWTTQLNSIVADVNLYRCDTDKEH